MKKLIFSLLLIAAASLFFTSCGKDKDEKKSYSASQVVGKWKKASSNEYWRYNADATGDFWDEDEDVHEGEGTHFLWSLSDADLRITYVGEMGQEVPRDYEIVELTSSKLVLKDANYDTQTTYYKQ